MAEKLCPECAEANRWNLGHRKVFCPSCAADKAVDAILKDLRKRLSDAKPASQEGEG